MFLDNKYSNKSKEGMEHGSNRGAHGRGPVSSESDITSDNVEKALVANVILSNDDESVIESELDELESLLKTLGIAAVGRILQKKDKISSSSFLGSGKLDEINQLIKDFKIKYLAFDRPLTGQQIKVIEEKTGCQALDRSGIILEIFAKHAKTNIAKIQVEIAQLEYALPRMAGAWSHFQRQSGGGVNMRGMGEKQIEIDRRRAREKISRLHKKLKELQRHQRTKSVLRKTELNVALVGYTNSGKTSIMNGMTKNVSRPEDKLFATLDATTRTIEPLTRPKILLSDTVGFIRKLPHSLVASFMSTLEGLKEADLLLHVVDVSSDSFKDHMKTTIDVLEEVNVTDIPIMTVFNKIDLIEDKQFLKILAKAYKPAIAVSADNSADMERLVDEIYNFFDSYFETVALDIHPQDLDRIAFIYKNCKILDIKVNDENSSVYTIRGPVEVINKIKVKNERDTSDPAQGK